MDSNINIEKFEDLLRSTERDGIDNLIDFIRSTDFYSAPASTKFHSCHEGGLLEHSLNVYECLKAKKDNPLFAKAFENVDDNTVIISALLHDLCKANFYATEKKNQKVYSESGSKVDAGGRYDWVVVPYYTVNDTEPYGHGEKSVMMCEEYIKLTKEEKYAIRWHMGFTEAKESYNTLSAAITKYPLILAIHEADLESTYLLESQE